jgi:uncharacterized protein YodC (DUF2158 family)
MDCKFKTGDVVRLKESNRQMIIKGHPVRQTVNGIELIFSSYVCKWMEGNLKKKAVFHEDALQHCEATIS